MADIQKSHQNDLAHHVNQAQAWLSASEGGECTAALSYAALELRFAVERLAVHYWASLLSRKLEEDDLREIESFKRVERRIYELAGHQKEINAHFEFMRIVMGALKVDIPLNTPNIGLLSRYWHDCSELCHIAWPLSCSVAEARKAAHSRLIEVAATLASQVQSLGWPILKEPSFVSLRDRFVSGDATAGDVLAHIHKAGVWAKVDFPDGRASQFVGEAVPPATSKAAHETPGCV